MSKLPTEGEGAMKLFVDSIVVRFKHSDYMLVMYKYVREKDNRQTVDYMFELAPEHQLPRGDIDLLEAIIKHAKENAKQLCEACETIRKVFEE